MPANAMSLNGWSKWYPYILSLVSVPVVYVAALSLYDQPMFAAVAASAVSLSLLVALRLWQSRGRLSLAITAFALPLLMALVCVGLQKLLPLAARQNSIDELAKSGISFTRRAATVNGEWVLDQSGLMLPLWMAQRIGPDCMTEVRGIRTSLQKLQEFDYWNIPNDSMTKIQLARDTEGPALSEDLVDWLNSCERAQLHLDLKHVTSVDLAAMAKLSPSVLNDVVLGFDDEIPEIDVPGVPLSLCVLGQSITPLAAEKLMHDRSNANTRIYLPNVESEVIEAIGQEGPRFILWYGTQFDVDNIKALHQQDISYLQLHLVTLPEAEELRAIATEQAQYPSELRDSKLENLAFTQSQATVEQQSALASCLRYRTMYTDLVLTSAQVEGLWNTTQLEAVTCTMRGEDGVYYSIKQLRNGEEVHRLPTQTDSRLSPVSLPPQQPAENGLAIEEADSSGPQ